MLHLIEPAAWSMPHEPLPIVLGDIVIDPPKVGDVVSPSYDPPVCDLSHGKGHSNNPSIRLCQD
jgi:hypothetical protein